MTTKDEISRWFDRGIARNATHMIVVCDTLDHEDYPCFANGDSDALEQYSYYNGKNMQRVMEVYDLRADKDIQMGESRAMRLPATKNTSNTDEPRLVSVAPDGSTCTLNVGGEEVYYDRTGEKHV